MYRIFSWIAATALVASVASFGPVSAGTPPTTVVAASATCAAGETYVKAYKKADGTMVSGYCRKASAAATPCPKGETYVKSYKKADGTVVKGYCRK